MVAATELISAAPLRTVGDQRLPGSPGLNHTPGALKMLRFSETICCRSVSSVFSFHLFMETGLFHELNRPGPSRLRV